MTDIFQARNELRYWTGGPTAQRLFAEALTELEQLRARKVELGSQLAAKATMSDVDYYDQQRQIAELRAALAALVDGLHGCSYCNEPATWRWVDAEDYCDNHKSECPGGKGWPAEYHWAEPLRAALKLLTPSSKTPDK